MSSVDSELQPFNLDHEGSTWLPRTDLDGLVNPGSQNTIHSRSFWPQLFQGPTQKLEHVGLG